MDIRERMVAFRKIRGIEVYKVAEELGISSYLLDVIENGGVTHPNIVERIRRFYGFTQEEVEVLMPENRRPSSPNYDLNKLKPYERPTYEEVFGCRAGQ